MAGYNRRGPNEGAPISGLKRGLCAGAAGDRRIIRDVCRCLDERFQSGRRMTGKMGSGNAWRRDAAFRAGESTPETELDSFRAEAKNLKDAIQAIHNRIDRMEKE